MLEALRSVWEAIIGYNWRGLVYGVRSVFFFLDLLVIVGFIVVFFFALQYRPHFVRKPQRVKRAGMLAARREAVQGRWNRIIAKSASNPPQSYVIAIIEADKCVDDVLKEWGLKGEHMADRLEQLNPADFRTLDRLWRAHRIRNDLVHTPDFGVNPADAKEVLAIYEAFLKELEVL
jgi:hypothetical protein